MMPLCTFERGFEMLTTHTLLDLAKQRNGIASDYKLGLVLDVVPSAVKNYRKGRSHPDDLVAQRLADLCDLDRGMVVASIHAQRAANEDTRALWRSIADRLQQAGAAALAVILSVGLTASPDAGATPRAHAPSEVTGLYIM